MTEMEQQKSAEITQDSKNLALLLWIGTLFFGFIPGLIFYLVKADDAYIKAQSMEALNWSITAILAYLAAFMLSFIVIGVFLIPVIGICHLIFCIMGAVAASKGNPFRVPFTLRLIK
ncbi:DUF4870 domain-containing protein [Halopseudomonas yangmingensis]|uniref:DUF4870 domain-containing protein n=1 Tax=Halopseudomonas yangmingensis TaxID=1720063 RepID=A0A1I4T0S7_9GAMM|nr:DUF4870 domain-containing protein [Halopseudomonas yangmingensis]SFM70180.1 hypothetical protein SAMN05216217_11248 [Halopseudomonas yangmingensis]